MNSVNTKLKSALDKQIVERLTKVTDNHRIETALPTKPVNVRNAGTPTEFWIDIDLVLQGAMSPFNGLQFDSDLLSQ